MSKSPYYIYYWYLSASTGCNLDALNAGNIPKNNPVAADTPKAKNAMSKVNSVLNVNPFSPDGGI